MAAGAGDRITDVALILDNAYLTELEANCRMFLRAWASLEAQLLGAPGGDADEALQRRIRLWAFESWGAAYSMIEAARRIVRVMWEVRGSKGLRARYHLDSNSSFQRERIRAIRDALEHTESRIPDFVAQQERGDISGWGVTNEPREPTHAQPLRFRHLNLATGECYVEDQVGRHTLNLRELEKAVRALLMTLPASIGGSTTVLHLPPESGPLNGKANRQG